MTLGVRHPALRLVLALWLGVLICGRADAQDGPAVVGQLEVPEAAGGVAVEPAEQLQAVGIRARDQPRTDGFPRSGLGEQLKLDGLPGGPRLFPPPLDTAARRPGERLDRRSHRSSDLTS